MSEELEAQIFIERAVLIGGISFIAGCLLIAFLIIYFALKRQANKEVVKQDFLKENRSNGKHVEHGNANSKH